jgi:hypothetical protein
MGKKHSKNLKKFRLHKQLALKILPAVALVLIATGAAALLFHTGKGPNSQQRNINVDNLSVKTEPKPADAAASSEVPAPTPSTSQTISSAPTPQDTCDEQAAADATARAKAAHEYTIAHWNSSVPYYEDQYAQGKITYEQLQAEKSKDSFTLESDLDWINQALARTIASLGCPVSYPLF